MAAANHHYRDFFTPADVPDDLCRATRRCVPACCALLGLPPPPKGAHPQWSQVLKRISTERSISPQDYVIRNFNSLDDIKDHLDNLYVATMNKNERCGAGHSAVIYRGRDQMGSMKCHLFNPGKSSPYGEIDFSSTRNKRWNYICAVFTRDTNLPTNESETILFVDSSDDDDEEEHPQIIQSRTGSAAATAAASASRPSSSRTLSPTIAVRGGVDPDELDVRSNEDGGAPLPRRNPSRVTKTKRTSSLVYKERLVAIPTRQDYSRVSQYDYNDQFDLKQCTLSMIGQHIAKYLLARGDWVVWYHPDSSQFIIARKENFSGYDIEGAELGKAKFIGYTALAQWAFKEGIFQESLQTEEGRTFLNVVQREEDDLNKLFINTTAAAAGKKRRKRYLSCDGANAMRRKKNKKGGEDEVEVALQEQIVADFEEEEENLIANESSFTEQAAGKGPSRSGDDRSWEESSVSTVGGNENDDDDEDYVDWKHDEEEGLKPKHVPTKTANQESSQENNDDDVSGLDDDVSDRGAAQSSQQQQEEDNEGRNRIEAGSPAILSEAEDLREEMDAKSQTESETTLKAELKAKSNELKAARIEVHRLSNENNVFKAQVGANSKTRAEDADSAQDELRRLHDEIETKNGEITRLRHELPTSTAAAAAQDSIPDYIVEACNICFERVAFGNEEEGTEKILLEVFEALSNRDEMTIRLAKRSMESGKSAEEVVDGLVKIKMKMVQIERKG